MIKNKKKLIIIFVILTSIFIYDITKYKTIDFSTHNQESMRFNLKLENKKVLFVNNIDLNFSSTNGIDKEFKKNCKTALLSNVSIKYGEYLFTRNKEYVSTRINDQPVWINAKPNINKKYKQYKQYLKRFFTSNLNSYIEITPFNNTDFCLISNGDSNGTEQYIVDLKHKKITWTRDTYYESPNINFRTDMLECRGDLSAKTYIFNKQGKLIKTLGFW